ncbi:NAD(P)-dependent oxidoreductase [Frigidibacter sp. SD6-1]|uniref:NAD-dependent epimerase/dehydratase family protein n=1 Tax=Frigidibacter sp. SD6-1 TaxID=3032581 RepID=UPI0024DFFBC0|nr:NAD(P)-dependent oxidoreductase [Frigidibacter sp. SD6-1]
MTLILRCASARSPSPAALLAQEGSFDAVFAPNLMTAADGKALLEARDRFDRLCVISTVSVYCDDEGRCLDTVGASGFPHFACPLAETSPILPPGEGYSRGKAAMEAAIAGPGVSILRPSAIWGIGARHPREWWFVKRALDGRTCVPIAFGGESVFHTCSVTGIARLAALCMATGFEGALNVADATSPSVAEIAATLGDMLGHRFDLVPVSDLPEECAHVGHTPWSAEHPIIIDTARARALGWKPDSYAADRLAPYLDWMRGHEADWRAAFPVFGDYRADPFDYAAEDRMLAAC